MSAPIKFDLDGAEPLGKDTPTPADLTLKVRDMRFCRDERPGRWWAGGNPVATAWHNSLSVAFPKGEAMFIEAIRAHREGTPPKLEAEIRAFVKQEANHTREHVAFNNSASEVGYDLSGIEAAIDRALQRTRSRPPIVNLAATMALEHLTALLARETLTNPKYMAGAHGEAAELWRWHAVEEIEHKGVACDTWLHATRGWRGWKRWKLKSFMALISTRNFMLGRVSETLALLEQDGLAGAKWKWKLALYLLWSPGVLRRILPAWIAFFLPGFHPWKRDDRALISRHDSAYRDAVLPSAE